VGDDYPGRSGLFPDQRSCSRGIGVEALAGGGVVPGVRRVIDGMLDRTDALVEIARGLRLKFATFGLRRESAVMSGWRSACGAAAARRSVGSSGQAANI